MANDIIGAPEPIVIKGRVFHFSPLNDLEYSTLDSWIRFSTESEDANHTNEEGAVKLATWQGAAQILSISTKRTEFISVADAAQYLEGNDSAIEQVIDAYIKLNYFEISFDVVQTVKENTNTINSKSDIYLELSRLYYWTPQQILLLTPFQRLTYLGVELNKPKGISAIHFDTEEEYAAWKRKHK